MNKLNCFDYDFSFLFFIENFCNQDKFSDFSFNSIVKENLLSHFYSYNFNLYKDNYIEKNFQLLLNKNEFLIIVGDKISFIIGLINLKYIKNVSYYLSILIIAKRTIPFDLKIFITSYNIFIKQFNLEKNLTNNDWLKNEISIIFFIVKKFKKSAEYFVNLSNIKFNKNAQILVNKKLYFKWLHNLKTIDFWNKIKTLYLKFNIYEEHNYSNNLFFSLKKYKKQKFLKLVMCFHNNSLFSLHRQQLLINFKKLIFLEIYKYFKNRSIKEILYVLNIVKISKYICKEICNNHYFFLNLKNLNYLFVYLESRNLLANKLLSKMINFKLIKLKLC